MRIIDPGHRYELHPQQVLQFLKKTGFTSESTPATLVTEAEGTTNEEVIEVLIDRISGLNTTMPSIENEEALDGLRRALEALGRRKARREAANLYGTDKEQSVELQAQPIEGEPGYVAPEAPVESVAAVLVEDGGKVTDLSEAAAVAMAEKSIDASLDPDFAEVKPADANVVDAEFTPDPKKK